MAFRRTEGMSMIQALAMTVAEIPVFLYTTFGQSAFSQLRLTPGLRKVLFATALGTVALALAAHQLKRRRRRKKQVGPEMGGAHLGTVPLPILMARKVPSVKKGYSSRRMQSPSSKSNDTLSGISSIEPSKHSGSCHSLASMVAVNSSSPMAACSGPWDTRGMEESVTASDGNAESLYMQGMELFEEALQKWEQALSVGQRGDSSRTPTPGDSLRNPETASEVPSEPESQRREFAEKLESLLHRAYHLQEEFGSTFPADSVLLDLERTLMLPLTEGSLHLRVDDEDSLTSEGSFFSATELFESLQVGDDPILLSRPAAAYEEALQLVKEGKVPCRTLRTELLGCYSDQDFLAKLHCVRQAFEGLLEDKNNQLFFGEVGRQMVTGLMTKAEKSPKGFLESYEEMMGYALRPETWATTRLELEGRGVVCMSFFDIVLDRSTGGGCTLPPAPHSETLPRPLCAPQEPASHPGGGCTLPPAPHSETLPPALRAPRAGSHPGGALSRRPQHRPPLQDAPPRGRQWCPAAPSPARSPNKDADSGRTRRTRR